MADKSNAAEMIMEADIAREEEAKEKQPSENPDTKPVDVSEVGEPTNAEELLEKWRNKPITSIMDLRELDRQMGNIKLK